MKDYIEESRVHFNKQASQYDENTSNYYSGPAKISCKDIENYLKNIEYLKLLDVGCGTGWLLDNLSKQRPVEYYGIDISENMLEKAKSKQIKGAEFTLGKSHKLPYADETFDIVTCVQSFHHYQNQEESMKEAYRVLKNGGLYIISDTGIGGIGGWFDNNILFKILKSGDYRTTNSKGITKQMLNNGFEVIRTQKLASLIYTVVGQKN